MLGRIGQANDGSSRLDGPAKSAEPAPSRAARLVRRLPRLPRLSRPAWMPGWIATWSRALARVTLRLTAVLVPIAILAAGLLYIRLLNGPISLSFMVEPIQRVLNEEMPGIQFGVEDAIVQLTSSGAVEFRLTSVRITEDTGSLVALASRASVQLSLSALRRGRIAPSRIDLLQPRIVMFESDRPAYTLGYGRDLQGRTLTMPPRSSEEPVARPTRETEVVKTVTIGRGRIDAARRVAEIAAQMRRRSGAASFLETLGLKDASLVMSDDGQQTVVQIPSLELTMRHMSRRSIVEGGGTIAAGGAPFKYRFRTEDSEREDRMKMTVDVEELIPRSLAQVRPAFALLDGLEVPATGHGMLELSRQGEVIRGTFDVTLGAGRAHLPWLGNVPLELSGGDIKATYAGDTRRLDIETATLRWRSSHATVKGMIEPATGRDGAAGWRIDVDGIEGRIASDEIGAEPLRIDKLVMRGIAFPDSGRAEISQFLMNAGPANIAMAGNIAASGNSRVARLDGRIGPMPIEALKAMWPVALAPQTRQWVAGRVVTGRLSGGSFSIVSRRAGLRDGGDAPAPTEREIALDLEVDKVGIEYLKGMPLLEAANARLTINGNAATFFLPAAVIKAAPGQHLQIQDARLLVSGVDQERPLAHIEAKFAGPASGVLSLLDRPPLGLLRNTALEATGFDGKLDARFSAKFPIHDALSMKDVQIVEAKASVVEGNARKVMGRYTISGASIRAEARDNVIDVAGEALLEGVLTRLSWRHALMADPKDLQSLKLRAMLGNSERAQLGINLGELVSGDVQLDLTIRPGDEEAAVVRAVADLTAAEINLSEVSWLKPAGQRAELRFDLSKRRDGNVVLQNFRLDGDTIGVSGWVALGADNRPIEYLFTDFSLNTVSNLSIRGVLRPDRVWEVKANGPRFDGQDLFRGFLNVGKPKGEVAPSRSAGIDIEATLDTVSGVPDASNTSAPDPRIRSVQLRMSRRGHDLQELQFSGRHDNGRVLKASMKATPGQPRVLLVEAADAGEALKLIGIYRHMDGGDGRLEINLDGSGPAERRGMMTVRHFKVIGDQVVSDVVTAADEGQPAIQQGARPGVRRVVREQIDFDRLRTAFATGSGQLVIEDMEVTGPVLSATLRGTLDYRRRFVQLGGTYTPLSGLNRALSSVPLFGEVLTGPRREGVVAMTFAIQGPMPNPQVIPNPLSLMTPGFLREIFQMAPNNPTISPDRAPARKGPQPQTTESPPATGPSAPQAAPSSDAAVAKKKRAKPKSVTPEVSDGWAATTDPRAKPSERN
jgi:hypothetical protein